MLQHIVRVEILTTHISFFSSRKGKSRSHKNNEVLNLRFVMKEVYLRFNCVNVKLIYANFCRPTFLKPSVSN